jgi:hypothetical protein
LCCLGAGDVAEDSGGSGGSQRGFLGEKIDAALLIVVYICMYWVFVIYGGAERGTDSEVLSLAESGLDEKMRDSL